MNYKAIVLILAVAVGGMETANGQFLKKLGKKVEKAAERTVERRAERETEKKTDQALDKILEPGDKKGKKEKGETEAAAEGSDRTENNAAAAKNQAVLAAMLGGGSMEDVPDSYTFSYRATMKITNKDTKEETAMQYWLEPDATYFGTKVLIEGAANNMAVMDMGNEAMMVMFMDNGDRKTAMRLNGSQDMMDKYLKVAVENKEGEDIKVTAIESKTILGYHCKGFQMETSDGVSKVWVTEEAPVGLFSGMFQTDNVPEGMPDFGPKALFMEMEYLPKDGQDDPYRMVCTELKQESLAIHKKDYQSAI